LARVSNGRRLRPSTSLSSTRCARSPTTEALIAFFESTDYESAVRLAMSLGGDSDTLAAITGGVAHAFYGVMPDLIVQEVRGRLPDEFLRVVDEFGGQFSAARLAS
jgi:ADP-ribosylglycohydrolase